MAYAFGMILKIVHTEMLETQCNNTSAAYLPTIFNNTARSLENVSNYAHAIRTTIKRTVVFISAHNQLINTTPAVCITDSSMGCVSPSIHHQGGCGAMPSGAT